MASRVFKFRAWVKGFLPDQQGMFYPTLVTLHGDGTPERIFTDEFKFKHDEEHITLMQYTGLHDKNGREIYEGDIASLDDSAYTLTVYWDSEDWCGWAGKYEPNDLSLIKGRMITKEWAARTEVIGNIYENPELLGKGE